MIHLHHLKSLLGDLPHGAEPLTTLEIGWEIRKGAGAPYVVPFNPQTFLIDAIPRAFDHDVLAMWHPPPQCIDAAKVTFKVPGGPGPALKSARVTVWNADGGELILEVNSEFVDGLGTHYHINDIVHDFDTIWCFEGAPASPYPVSYDVHIDPLHAIPRSATLLRVRRREIKALG